MRSAQNTEMVLLRSFSPLGLALLVVSVFLLFLRGFHVNTSTLPQLAALPAGGLLGQAKLHATRSHWATALFASVVQNLAELK